MSVRSSLALAAVLSLSLSLAACGEDSGKTASSSGGTTSPAGATGSSAGTQCAGVKVSDAWVKAAPAGKTMTGAFGTLKNEGTAEVHLVGGESLRAPKVELHEMAMKDGKMVMQAKAGGFVIKPGASITLAPGKDHVMLMDLTGALAPGESVTITLKCQDGSTVPMSGEVRTFSGGNESYHGGAPTRGMDGHSGMPTTMPGPASAQASAR